MKLRNKKTGKVGWLELYYDDNDNKMIAVLDEKSNYHPYDSLAELNEEWEDYKPAEPLIKDEKIRKAVRAWAELVPSAQVRYDIHEGRLYTYSDYIMPYSISFPTRLGLDEMTDYTIAELCGKDDE